MPVETRFAVRRDQPTTGRIEWWHWQPREEFNRDWDDRKLFERRESALAVIWRQRDIDHQGHYRFVLIRVTRNFDAPAPRPRAEPAQERRVP